MWFQIHNLLCFRGSPTIFSILSEGLANPPFDMLSSIVLGIGIFAQVFGKGELSEDTQHVIDWNTDERLVGEVATAMEELSKRMENLEEAWEMEKAELESKVEDKNKQVEQLAEVVEKIWTQCESNNEEVDNIIRHMRRHKENHSTKKINNKEVRDLPYMMLCAFRADWRGADNIIFYDRITMDYNNADQPGGEFSTSQQYD